MFNIFRGGLFTQAFLTLVFSTTLIHAERYNNFTVTHKYSTTTDGYFTTPHLIKARAFWETQKTLDLYESATISVADQVGFAAGSQTADVLTPDNLASNKPVGIYIHVNYSDAANFPSNLKSVLQDHYLIGATPANAGNNRHDLERIARVLDLVTTLKAQYNIDDSRVYVGGTSGGALLAVACGMLYPDTFPGIIATEHVMAETYWNRIFTFEDMYAMVAHGQRWSHILGEDSYAYSNLAPRATEWKYDVFVDSDVSPIRVHYEPFFDTYNVVVPGMAHSNPPPAIFEQSLIFVDAHAQRPRVRIYQDWEKYAFRMDDPQTVFFNYNVGESMPQGGDPTINHEPEDDFDGDGYSNWYEYLVNTDPTIANDTPTMPLFSVSGTGGILRHRANAIDQRLVIHTSTDLSNWDTTGNGVQISSITTTPDQTMATTHFTHRASNPTILFYLPVINYVPVINLTQLSGASASQSTTGWGGLAEYAIDGNRDANFNNNSTSHTDTTSQNWWQVDLGAEYDLSRIQFFNRSDNQTRLSNFRVSILNEIGAEVVSKDYYLTTGHVGNSEIWDLPEGTLGRRVKVSMLGLNRAGNTILSLAELEVLGFDPTP